MFPVVYTCKISISDVTAAIQVDALAVDSLDAKNGNQTKRRQQKHAHETGDNYSARQSALISFPCDPAAPLACTHLALSRSREFHRRHCCKSYRRELWHGRSGNMGTIVECTDVAKLPSCWLQTASWINLIRQNTAL